MKKNVLIGCLFISILATAQTKTINGIIKDDKGAVVPYAVIQIKGTNKGINADSAGTFSLHVKPNAVLLVNAMGYETASINVGQLNSVSVILKTNSSNLNDVTVESQLSTKSDYSSRRTATTMIEDFTKTNNVNNSNPGLSPGTYLLPGGVELTIANGGGANLYTGQALPVFTHKEDTKGSKYMFDQWVRGSAINSSNQIISNEKYWFNYDKISRRLLVTEDKMSVVEVSKNNLNGFTLLDKNKNELVFEKLDLIDPNNFMIQLLKDTAGYSLYKSIQTKFIHSNYRSDGLTESGNNYDEYADEYTYYILFPGGKQFSKVELKKKSIKEVLIKEEKKVKSFFAQHGSDDLDEFFLMALVASLNM